MTKPILNFQTDVTAELKRGRKKHPKPINSAHEGYSVVMEELDEVWEEVKKKRNHRDPRKMYAELVQVAATAQRMAEEVAIPAIKARRKI